MKWRVLFAAGPNELLSGCRNGGCRSADVVSYLNCLSDVIWLFARLIELNAGVNAPLRDDETKAGPKWWRA